jgi:hypothetical protein
METMQIALSVFDEYRAEILARQKGLSLDGLVSFLLSREVIITSSKATAPNPAASHAN